MKGIDPTKFGLPLSATIKQIHERLRDIASHHGDAPVAEESGPKILADDFGEGAPVLPEGAAPVPRPANFGKGKDHL